MVNLQIKVVKHPMAKSICIETPFYFLNKLI